MGFIIAFIVHVAPEREVVTVAQVLAVGTVIGLSKDEG